MRGLDKTSYKKLFQLLILGILFLSFIGSLGFLYISSLNYPGGFAFHELHVIEKENPNVHVHIDVYSAMTGVSRFGQLRNDWKYVLSLSRSLLCLK